LAHPVNAYPGCVRAGIELRITKKPGISKIIIKNFYNRDEGDGRDGRDGKKGKQLSKVVRYPLYPFYPC